MARCDILLAHVAFRTVVVVASLTNREQRRATEARCHYQAFLRRSRSASPPPSLIFSGHAAQAAQCLSSIRASPQQGARVISPGHSRPRICYATPDDRRRRAARFLRFSGRRQNDRISLRHFTATTITCRRRLHDIITQIALIKRAGIGQPRHALHDAEV